MSDKAVTRLNHIEEACELIYSYNNDLNREKFFNDQKVIDAVVRRFEIIGEAAGALPEGVHNRAEEINWEEWIGFRNLLIHQYPNVKKHILWRTIHSELPAFEKKICALKKQLTT